MLIAICDADSVFRRELRNYIFEYKKNKRFHADIYEFSSGEDMLSSNLFFDLIFLAYRLPNADGMQIARRLRSENNSCGIVFVTDYTGFVYEAFEVAPYRFFTKPINQENINSVMDSFILQQKNLLPLVVSENGEQKIVPSKEIVYLEGDGKYCIIRTTTETLHSSKTLSEVLAVLPRYCFFRIHRSYAVNMNYISLFDNKRVTFINGEMAAISRKYLADFKEAYEAFLNNNYLKI